MLVVTVHNVKLADGYVAPGSEVQIPDTLAEVLLKGGAVRKTVSKPDKKTRPVVTKFRSAKKAETK